MASRSGSATDSPPADPEQKIAPKHTEDVERVAIRFAGDSGDGMQLTGTKFTESTALAGNDLSTFPDFPAEIRAPAGTLAGVSAYQIHFASEDIFTPADEVDLLVAFNPAALRANLGDVRGGGMIITNSDAFTKKAWARAGYEEDPMPDLRERTTSLKFRSRHSTAVPAKVSNSVSATLTGARTSLPWVYCTGSTDGRWNPPSDGCVFAFGATLAKPTCAHCAPETPSVRPRNCFLSPSMFPKPK
jgi:Pyruvate/2-oxoacid:ferredoxin oxidoreductase gamma subunit